MSSSGRCCARAWRTAPAALSVLAAMEAEHERIDPLLAAVDSALARDHDRLADVIDALTSSLTGHLGHEERDGLPAPPLEHRAGPNRPDGTWVRPLLFQAPSPGNIIGFDGALTRPIRDCIRRRAGHSE